MNKSTLFFIGLFVGISICVILYYIDSQIFSRITSLYSNKQPAIELVTDTVFIPVSNKKSGSLNETNLELDSSSVNGYDPKENDESTLYDAEFSFESDISNDVLTEQLIQSKTVKVKVLQAQESGLPDNFIRFFEIQRWETPIKNKITYYRNQNIVKIKGMDIERFNVVYFNDLYYLETANRYFAIPETEFFEKLSIVTISP